MSIADILNYASTMPAWMEDASCAYSDGEMWFSDNWHEVQAAKRICRNCPVIAQCLTFAVESRERYGVYGGLTAKQRRPLIQAADERGAA